MKMIVFDVHRDVSIVEGGTHHIYTVMNVVMKFPQMICTRWMTRCFAVDVFWGCSKQIGLILNDVTFYATWYISAGNKRTL